MDGSEFILAVVSRWVHVGTAIVLVGGTSFMKLVLSPSLHGHSPELMTAIRRRWKRFVHGGIGLFILTGFFNYVRAMPEHKGDSLYHALMGTKIILAFAVFFIASALVGRSVGTQKFRDKSGSWMAVVLLLMAVIVGISGVLKVRASTAATKAFEPPSSGAALESLQPPASWMVHRPW